MTDKFSEMNSSLARSYRKSRAKDKGYVLFSEAVERGEVKKRHY